MFLDEAPELPKWRVENRLGSFGLRTRRRLSLIGHLPQGQAGRTQTGYLAGAESDDARAR
jgi:hypothetical protein